MAIEPVQLDNLVITYPLQPLDLVDKLREVFPSVDFYPGLQGNDYSTPAKSVPLPSPEEYERAHVLLTFNLPSNLKHWSQTPNLRLLQLVGAGAAQITESEYFRSFPPEHPLILATASGIHVPSISEHVLMSTLALLHKLPVTEHYARQEKRWASPGELGMSIRELRGMKVGIAGYGHLGREIGRLFAAFGCEILAANRDGKRGPIGGFLIPGTGDPAGALPSAFCSTSSPELVTDFLPQLDVLVSCLPSTSSTRQFFNEEKIKAMKNDAIYVNVGRGDAAVTSSLLEALQAGSQAPRSQATGALMLGGAVLDVTDPEPLPQGHALFGLPNLILTPHSCWMSEINFVRSVEVAITNTGRLRAGLGALNALRGKGERD